MLTKVDMLLSANLGYLLVIISMVGIAWYREMVLISVVTSNGVGYYDFGITPACFPWCVRIIVASIWYFTIIVVFHAIL